MAAPAVPRRQDFYILTVTGQTLALSEQAAAVLKVLGSGALTTTSWTSFAAGITSATATGTFAQVTATAEAPGTTVGLGPGFQPGLLVVVDYVPASELPTDQ